MPRIDEIFNLNYGNSLELNRLEQATGPDAVNFVGRATRNNGVTARVKPIQNTLPSPAGTITVALNGQGGAGVAFLQPFPFYSGFHIMVLTPKAPMTEQEKLWWVLCITANRFRYGFGRQANRTLKDIMLPDLNHQPRWVGSVAELVASKWRSFNYDEIFGVKKDGWTGKPLKPNARFSARSHTARTKCLVKLSDLFEVAYGVNLELNRMDMDGEGVNFVSRSGRNNGVVAKVKRLLDVEPIEAGMLTVAGGGSVLETFVQPEPFYSGRDLYYLRPKIPMSLEQKLYYCMCVRANKYRYNYGRQANRTLRDIRLPPLDAIPAWVLSTPFSLIRDWNERLAHVHQMTHRTAGNT